MSDHQTKKYEPMHGGPLDGCEVWIRRDTEAQGVLPIRSEPGRYVEIDGEWHWEVDHRAP